MERLQRVKSAIAAWAGEDPGLLRFVVALSVVQLGLSTWELPNSWSWEVDAVAPRELFAGLADNLTPGARHRYPLLQYLLILPLALPSLLLGLMRSEGWSTAELEAALIEAPIMSGVSFGSKLLTVTMGAILLLTLARIARRTFSAAAGRWAVAFAVVNLSVGYYARTNNLDVPYLMWTALAIDRLLDVGAHGRRSDYFVFAALVGAAVGTKDQAYAAIVLPGLIYLVAWPSLRGPGAPGSLGPARPHFRWLAQAIGVGAVALGLLGGGLLNPLGFVRRFQTLIGPASQDFRVYERSLEGLTTNLGDLAAAQAEFWWPWPIVLWAWAGVAYAASAGPADASLGRRAWRLLPACAAGSSLLFFTLVVGRCEHRFALPLGFWLALYAGVSTSAAIEAFGRRAPAFRPVALLAGALLVSSGARGPVALVLTQWGDARFAVEAYLDRLPAGTHVETWGRLPYQPRYSPDGPYALTHVHSTKGPNQRPPIPGAVMLKAPYEHVFDRAPEIIVVPSTFIHKRTKAVSGEGRAMSKHIDRYQQNEAVVQMAGAIAENRLPGYRLALHAEARLPTWGKALGMTPVRIHGSTGRPVWVLRRADFSGAD